jgi:hypothetical protein
MVSAEKDQTARALADAHYRVEPDLMTIIRLRRASDLELLTEEPIKLLEVNPATVSSGVMPLQFGPEPAYGIPFSSVIIEVTPEEFDEIRTGRLTLPDDWQLAEPLPRQSNGDIGAFQR